MLREDIELCNESDPSDPDYGPPETWGLWADWDTIELGPAFFREESLFDEEPAPDPLPLTDQADLEDLRHWERLEPFAPDHADIDDIAYFTP
jgi:hypothetical protein